MTLRCRPRFKCKHASTFVEQRTTLVNSSQRRALCPPHLCADRAARSEHQQLVQRWRAWTGASSRARMGARASTVKLVPTASRRRHRPTSASRGAVRATPRHTGRSRALSCLLCVYAVTRLIVPSHLCQLCTSDSRWISLTPCRVCVCAWLCAHSRVQLRPLGVRRMHVVRKGARGHGVRLLLQREHLRQ